MSSAGGLITLLNDGDPSLQSLALHSINAHLAVAWPEISDHISRIEQVFEESNGADKSLAALVIAKLYFHLADLDEALKFALSANADQLMREDAEFLDTIINACIDKYMSSRKDPSAPLDDKLVAIIDQAFSQASNMHQYSHVLGLAVETKRTDVIQAVLSSPNGSSQIGFVLDLAMSGIQDIQYRDQLLRLLVDVMFKSPNPDYFVITQCFVYLNDASLAYDLFEKLLASEKDEKSLLIAYQIAFDLVENASQQMVQALRTKVADKSTPNFETIANILKGEETLKLYLNFLSKNNNSDLLILTNSKPFLEGRNSIYHSALTFANAFASAGTASDQFLRENLDWLAKATNWAKFSAASALGVIHRGNLKNGKDLLEPYLPNPDGQPGSSVYSEGGALYALGLVHAGHGEPVLDYLVQQVKRNGAGEVVQHGAALAVGVAGLATANEDVYNELRDLLFQDNAISGEAAAYAMGLVMLGTQNGKAIDEMLQYAHETQHDKIIRGLAMGLAFLCYERQSEAETLISQLLSDKEAPLRYGGAYAIAMAYVGTASPRALQRLLHLAVSDANDDVCRAAVTALGFVLCKKPELVPKMVRLLSESYNPSVRYGSAMALGIACAGTASKDALDLLEPMLKDPTDFVRQGSCMAHAMILVQSTDKLSPALPKFRETCQKIISNKHEDPMAKFGATLSQGLLDAGGRNVTIGLLGTSGTVNRLSSVGMALFLQFWYWFPLAHCASLAFSPTAFIGIDKDLKMPKFEFTSSTQPSSFAYPEKTKPKEKEKVDKVATAVLSTTAKTELRQKTKDREKAKEDGDVDMADDAEEKKEDESKPNGDAMDTDLPEDSKKAEPEASTSTQSNISRVVPLQQAYISIPSSCRYQPIRPFPSPSTSTPNPAALLNAKRSQNTRRGGIVLLQDTKPDEEAEYETLQILDATNLNGQPTAAANATQNAAPTPSNPQIDATGPIAPKPASFEYDDWE